MRIRSRRANTERAPIPAPRAWVAGGLTGVLLFVAAGTALAGGRTGSPSLQALVATPRKITLRGRYDQARVLVEGQFGGVARDVSGEVALAVADPRVATADADGMVRPRRDGSTTLIARLRGRETRVPVEVRDVAKAGPPRFLTDVLPTLTKAGCNQGACHGAQQGKGGFKLSLLGYDPDADYQAITRASGGRRVSVVEPDNSLILRKPTLGVAHKGGKRFEVGSPEHRLLRDWILAGLPAPARVPASRQDVGGSEAAEKGGEPRVTRLEVIPPVRTLALGQSQRFIVRAQYTDGSQRDASGQTLFTASDEQLIAVDPRGEAKPVGPGEGAVVIRYQGLVAIARVISPFGRARSSGLGARGETKSAPPPSSEREATVAPRAPSPSAATPIDSLVFAKLAALGLEPSNRCTDAEFVRRAYLDVIGIPPTPDETRAFLFSPDRDKREKLIDALLARPEYVDFWTMKWGDILRNSRRSLSDKGMYSFYRWIRQSVAENKPWDQFARELLLARGSGFREGPANYFRIAGNPQELAETTAQVFLGVRVQCARCHNHPFERWTQDQYYQMAAFFARVKSKKGDAPGEQDVYLATTGEVKHPRTGKEMLPAALDAAPIPKDTPGDRRQALATWLTSAQNPFFAHVIVNRLWRHFMGRGLVEPVDDLRATNPPSNPALFDWLAQELVAHGCDLKHLMRTIMRSQTYQLSAQPMRGNERDTRYFSHYPFKRLGAEQLLDTLSAATSVPEKFSGFPLGTRAAQLPDVEVPSYPLDLFGRPARQIACECERESSPTVAQVLHLMNNTGINEKIAAKSGRAATLLAAGLPDRRVVDELYLAALSRFPTPEENRTALQALAASKDRQRAAEDLFWALLNTKEFLFEH